MQFINSYKHLISLIFVIAFLFFVESFLYKAMSQDQYPSRPPEPEAIWKANQAEFEKHIYRNSSGDSLNYRLLKPIQTEVLADSALPLVVFLHGAGERGINNEDQLKWGVWRFALDNMQQEYPAFVVAPQCPADNSWAPFMGENMDPRLADQPTQPMQLAIGMVKHIIEKYRIDTTRIYVTGMSMGGMGTWEMLMRRPEWFAAGAPICGAGDASKKTIKKVAEIPIWLFHGSADKIVNPQFSRKMYKALREAGAQPGYTEYPGVNHFSWIPAYRDQQLFKWMFSQQKSKMLQDAG